MYGETGRSYGYIWMSIAGMCQGFDTNNEQVSQQEKGDKKIKKNGGISGYRLGTVSMQSR
jgi:hypothetical protein